MRKIMWKKINNFLKDKNDYYLDVDLKQESEIAEELFQKAIDYQKYLIHKKIKYFFRHDKNFFLRLFLRLFFKFIILIISFLILTFIFIKVFNINIKLDKELEQPINYSETPIYIPSTGSLENDSLLILNYKKVFNDADCIIFYPKDKVKDFNKWSSDLQGIESNDWVNPYEARRDGSQYWGKYQMGSSARIEIGMGDISWEQWKTNPDLQEAALKMWIDILYNYLKYDIAKYDGKFLNGWTITESGIIAMAHNVGVDQTRQFLNSNGKHIPKDGSGKDATRFLILGNYDLNLVK